jgi:hypothetical protein
MTDADKLLAMELQARQAQAELLEKRTIADQLRESLLTMQYDSSVIRFKKQFEVDGKQYAYAAIFAGGRWYITGAAGSRSSYDLDQLILFLVAGKVPTRYVTKMVESHSNVTSITKTTSSVASAQLYGKELRIPLIKDELSLEDPPF